MSCLEPYFRHHERACPPAPCKVLVVDDERDLADLAEALLRSHGHAVVLAYSAAQALQVLEEDQAIDVVFSDITMPGMTGLELARLVRERYPKVKVLLTSGYIFPASLAGQDACHAYLPKPYRIEAVLELLHH